ncbi:Pfam:CXC, variant 2 [Parelaphostrongylus tenuis]|uniref:Pfam:CXC, variant 2 n=1 Tax=Parelaphostrongylus tenuis TaxID=148309 RepID=A0AAD5MMW5_PARTN|nr:Pfam:CXC, variant 2 [Parelaphostrongylus tenuis]
MSEANGECIHGMESKPLFFEQVLVSEDGEPIYIEEGDDYGVFNEEEYIRLEDGTFMANQHPLVSQSQSSQPSEPQMLQVQMAPIPQRMSTEPPRSQQFEAHHPIHQQQTYPPARLSHVSRYKSNLAKTPTVKEEFPRNVPQQSFELINTSNILSLPKVSSNISKPFTSTPSSSSVYQVPSTQTVSKPRKKPLPGQRKPCNCTKSMCLKLYCDCFANGEFCLECNCKDCHNNLEHGADRSKAIKQSLERNPNAFKPKIGVKSGKVDAERLHQKGCHCKKSGCLKNYCECFEVLKYHALVAVNATVVRTLREIASTGTTESVLVLL